MHQRFHVAIVCGALLVHSACKGQDKAPAARAPKPAAAPVVAAAPPRPDAPFVMHTISEGETLWDIARSYNVSMKDVMAANGFDSADIRRLHKGSPIKIPGATAVTDVQTRTDRVADRKALAPLSDGAYHLLHRGESLWTLARTYDIPIESIMERNGFSEDVHGQLRVGQAIIIPGIKASQVKQADTSAPRRNGFVHEITRGETVWDVARAFQVSVAEIMAANGLTADEVSTVRDGQKLFLPGVEDDGRGRIKRKSSAREQRAALVARGLGLGSVRAAGALLHGRVDKKWIRAAGGSGRLPGTLRWPVSAGWFVRGYGSGQGGYHKAMDIMGKIGWNVRAAADGIVGYSGDEVSGFGNMIMVVHPGGWVTLYGHNSVNFAVAGQRVRKGEVLAEVGSTGRSQGPHVHFELIYDGKNCDPAPLFRPGVRRRNGKVSRLDYSTWRAAAKRPTQVACAKRQKHPMGLSVESEIIDQATREAAEKDTSATMDELPDNGDNAGQ